MNDTNSSNAAGTCGCGRSPTGKCMGWHALSDEEFANAKQQWQIQEDTKRIFGISSSVNPGNPGAKEIH